MDTGVKSPSKILENQIQERIKRIIHGDQVDLLLDCKHGSTCKSYSGSRCQSERGRRGQILSRDAEKGLNQIQHFYHKNTLAPLASGA